MPEDGSKSAKICASVGYKVTGKSFELWRRSLFRLKIQSFTWEKIFTPEKQLSLPKVKLTGRAIQKGVAEFQPEQMVTFAVSYPDNLRAQAADAF